jgi:large subunit ribosomal protein L13
MFQRASLLWVYAMRPYKIGVLPGIRPRKKRNLLSHEDKLHKQYVERSDERYYLIDATDRSLGSVASQAAPILVGKNRPDFRPDHVMGDHVIIINAYNTVLTFEKWTKKLFIWHTGWRRGVHQTNMANLRAKKGAEFPLFNAIWSCLPKKSMEKRKLWMEKVFIFPDDKHPFEDKFIITLPKPPLPRPIPIKKRALMDRMEFSLRPNGMTLSNSTLRYLSDRYSKYL